MKIELETKTKYEVHVTSNFKRNLKRIKKQEKDISKLEYVITKLANNDKLEPKFKNHNLINDGYYKNCEECHISPDWILIYRYHKNELILLLIDTGSHSNLFDK